MAVGETLRLLKLANRATNARETPESKKKDERKRAAFKTFRMHQPDYTPGMGVTFSHWRDFADQYDYEFGGAIDMLEVQNTCRMLAVIFFCQLLKSGHADPDNVERNDKEFIALHLEQLLLIVCPSAQERSAFDALKEQLETARDQMLGHADAKAFRVERTSGTIATKMHSTSIEKVDFDLLETLAGKLDVALIDYMGLPAES